MSIFDALRRSKPVETVYGDFLRDIESGQFEQALKKIQPCVPKIPTVSRTSLRIERVLKTPITELTDLLDGQLIEYRSCIHVAGNNPDIFYCATGHKTAADTIRLEKPYREYHLTDRDEVGIVDGWGNNDDRQGLGAIWESLSSPEGVRIIEPVHHPAHNVFIDWLGKGMDGELLIREGIVAGFAGHSWHDFRAWPIRVDIDAANAPAIVDAERTGIRRAFDLLTRP